MMRKPKKHSSHIPRKPSQEPKVDVAMLPFEPRLHEQTQPPPEPVPPKERTPTPKEKTLTPSMSSKDGVAQLHYQDAEPEMDPEIGGAIGTGGTGGTFGTAGTGSQGRHFHFRYVDDDAA